jgi:nitrite reductase (NADH) small subunit
MSEIMIGHCGEFADGDYRVLAIGELEIAIFRLNGRFVAYENRCPHRGGPVCQGKLFNGVEEIIRPDQTSRGLRFGQARHVVCPWHGYEFDLETGQHPRATRASACGRYRCV